MLTIILFNHI